MYSKQEPIHKHTLVTPYKQFNFTLTESLDLLNVFISNSHSKPFTSLNNPFSGCVKLGRHRKTNEQVAVKIISKASLTNKAAVHRGIEREIAIMKLINHPHVIRLYDVYETEKEL